MDHFCIEKGKNRFVTVGDCLLIMVHELSTTEQTIASSTVGMQKFCPQEVPQCHRLASDLMQPALEVFMFILLTITILCRGLQLLGLNESGVAFVRENESSLPLRY